MQENFVLQFPGRLCLSRKWGVWVNAFLTGRIPPCGVVMEYALAARNREEIELEVEEWMAEELRLSGEEIGLLHRIRAMRAKGE